MGLRDRLAGWLGLTDSSQHGVLSPWADPTALESVTFAHLWALENLPLNRQHALSIPAVAKGVQILTGTIGRLPLIAMTGTTPAASSPAWIAQPEHGHPRYITLAATVDQMIFYGRAWWLVESRLSTGKPASFVLCPEDKIEMQTDGRVLLAGRRIDPADVIRIDAPHDGLLTFGHAALNKARALAAATARAADNPVPSVELHQTDARTPLSQAQIDDLVASWVKARQGKNGGVAYTSSSIEARVHGQPVEQLLIQASNQIAMDVARLLSIPAWAVDAEMHGSSLQYSNVATRMRELIDFGLAPYIAAIEARLSCDDVLPAGTWLRIDTTQVTRDDFSTRMRGYADAINAGIMTADDARRLEAGIPLEGNT